MKTSFRRIIGIILMTAAIFSLLVSLFLLVQTWRLRQPLSDRLVDNLDLLYATIVTTEDSLSLVETTLANLLSTTETLQGTTVSVAQSIHDTGLLTDSFATIVGDDFPTTIENTQTAISSAQSSAVVIDNLLYGLASIPLIGIDYDPPLPLNLALGQVGDSLSSLPAALEEIQGDLQSAHTNLLQVEENVIQINQHIDTIIDNLSQAQDVIDEYQIEIRQLKIRLEKSRNAAADWALSAAWLLTLLIVWLSISQLGLLMQGLDMAICTDKPSPGKTPPQ
jgi:methyl-accepting chemotaxis protein